MKLEKGEISSSQLMFLVAGFIQGSLVTLAYNDKITKQDTWLAVLAGLVLSVPFVLVYLALAQKFPGKNLIQIHDIIYGPYLGKLISALYLSFFLLIIAANLRIIGEFLITYIMPETPMLAIVIMFTFICAWAVRSGIEVIARTSFVFVVITIMSGLLTFVLLVKEMKLTNFLPVFETPLKDFIHGTHIMASIPFCEIFVFLMVIPYVNKIKQAKSSVLLGLIIAGATVLTISVRNTAVLGITSSIMVSPNIEAVRLIDIANIITRLEVLDLTVLLVTLFLKVSVFFYAMVLGLAQLFQLRSYAPLVLPFGIIAISLAVLRVDSAMEQGFFGANIWPIFAIPFYFLLPPFSLFLAKLRGLPKKQGGVRK